MNVIDLHCDTVNTCLNRSMNLFDNPLHLDIKRGITFDNWIQTFAFWIDNKYKEIDAWNRFLAQYELFKSQKEIYGDCMSLLTPDKKILPHHCNYVLSIEGGEMLNGDLSKIDFLKEIGVRFFTLVWNGTCSIGYGADTGIKLPLTAFGQEVAHRLNEVDITIDVSHLNEAGFYWLAENTTKPFVATHSNAKAKCNHFRNLTDEQIKIIRDKKGLIGLNFHKPFLNEDIEKSTSISDILVHTEHFLSLGCENILSIGSDFDGASISSEIKDIKGLENIYESMIKYFSKDIADKIFYGNALAFL